jgi:Fe-S cluster assembly protein SufD
MNNNESFKNLFDKLDGVRPVDAQEFRKKSFKRFEELGLPNKSNEAWKYTSIKPIQSKTFTLPLATKNPPAKDPNEITISCVNGFFDIDEVKKELSQFNIEVLNFSEALKKDKIETADSKDAFFALNCAFYENGLFFSIAARTEITKPIVIRYTVTPGTSFVNPRVFIHLEEETSLELVEIFAIDSGEYFLNSSLQVKVGERASFKALKHYKQKYLSSHVDNTFIEQANSSSCQLIQLSSGSQLLRQNLEVTVSGEGAYTDLRGISLLSEKNKMDNFVKIHHKAPGSTSRQAFKSILRDEAHYVFQGNIRIEKEAQKTDSDQVNRNLMLGQKCHVDTKPQLDVYADDVKATHGAAIGQLSPDEKFYLESRAISPEQALTLLCDGFALDLLENLKSNWAKKYLRDNL